MKSVSLDKQDYKSIEKEGVTVIILNKKRILLLKRINLPFLMVNPGIWYFVAGSRARKEDYLDTAYREIMEEISMDKSELKPLLKNREIMIADNRRGLKWKNAFFIFCAKTDSIKLNYEHTDYRWVSFKEFVNDYKDAVNSIYDKERILPLIKSCISRC